MDKLICGIWPNGCCVTYPESAVKEGGTIDEASVVGWYASMKEAREAADLANGATPAGHSAQRSESEVR